MVPLSGLSPEKNPPLLWAYGERCSPQITSQAIRLVYPAPSPFLTKELEYRAREGQALRIYFRNDRSLFADISKIIFSIISKRPPPKEVASFWQWIIPSLSKHRIRKQIKNQNRLSQYIARHPVSLNKIIYIPEKAQVLYKTKYNDYFGENIQAFSPSVITYYWFDDLPMKLKKPESPKSLNIKELKEGKITKIMPSNKWHYVKVIMALFAFKTYYLLYYYIKKRDLYSIVPNIPNSVNKLLTQHSFFGIISSIDGGSPWIKNKISVKS